MKDRRIKVGVAGATGYVGIELIRILAHHPHVELTCVATQSHAQRSLKEVYPHLHSIIDLQCIGLDAHEMAKQCDVVFLALPHGLAADLAPPILEAGKKVIDLGADFRLKDGAAYKRWYGVDPAPASLLEQAVYGLPEITDSTALHRASLVANPGCYPTSIALGAYPALSSGMIEMDRMVFDAKSGTSGAGRSLALNSHFCEVAENFKAYAVGGTHRHTPEIEQVLTALGSREIVVQFTPHLLPMVRGLLTTAYFQLRRPMSLDEVWHIYAESYRDKPFIRLQPAGTLPQTAHVRCSNYCDVGLSVDLRTQSLLVVSAIDNLVKGASGQAIQNMNIMFELPETMGLLHLCPVYP